MAMHKNGRHEHSEAPNDMMGQKTEIGKKDIASASGSFKTESDGSLGGKTSTKLPNTHGHTRETTKGHGDRA